MEFDRIVDDVWITVFEHVSDPGVLAVLVRTCRRFQTLASKLLLRELRWMKPESTLRNLGAWNGVYSSVTAMTRKVTIGVPFDFSQAMRNPRLDLSADMALHDLLHAQLLRFSNLNEITLDGTIFSPYTYSIIASIPNLRTLNLNNITFIPLYGSFRTRRDAFAAISMPGGHLNRDPAFLHAGNTSLPAGASPGPPPPPPFHGLSITHISLHGGTIPTEMENGIFHPLCLLTIPALTSLSIFWLPNTANRYGQSNWVLHHLRELEVEMPALTRDLLFSLAAFVDRCPRNPRVKLRIGKHNLSEAQLGLMQVPLRGVWSYEGPLAIAACSASQALHPTLTQVVTNEALELGPLLEGLEKLPRGIEDLEIHVRCWDMEVLFAVKALFKSLKKLVLRYIRGFIPTDLAVTLGADILFHLPALHTLKLLQTAVPDDSNSPRFLNHHLGGGNGSGGGGGPGHGGGAGGGHPQWQLHHHYHSHHPAHHAPAHPLLFHSTTSAATTTNSFAGGAGNVSSIVFPGLNTHATATNPQVQQADTPAGPRAFAMPLPLDDTDLMFEEDDEEYYQLVEDVMRNSTGWTTGATQPIAGVARSEANSAEASREPSTTPSHTTSAHATSNAEGSSSSSAWYANPAFARTFSSPLATTQDIPTPQYLLGHRFSRFPSASPSTSANFFNNSRDSPSPAANRISEPSLSSSRSELGDYLIGWSRYCPALRVLQVDTMWWWERRFEGDRWLLKFKHEERNGNGKGKEKERSDFFAGPQ